MMARKSTGKRLRFRVFERDGFVCQYCGKYPPEVILHVDHIVPVSKGGENEIENLLTACADCNLGKATFELGKFPKQVGKNVEDVQERYEQLKAFFKFQKKLSSLKECFFDEIYDYWIEVWDTELTQQGKSGLKTFLKNHSIDEIKEAIDISCTKIMDDPDRGFRYMCGVLHQMRKNRKINRE